MSERYNEKKEGLIDITGLIDDLIKGAFHMKWRFLILIILCVVIYCGYKRITYSPYYEATSTFTISASISAEASDTYMDNATANQMAKNFPIHSGKRSPAGNHSAGSGKTVCTGKIEADVMENTNLFTLKVTADDPEMANKILQSVVKNYPTSSRICNRKFTADTDGRERSPRLPRQIRSATVMKSSSAVLSEWFYAFCWIFCLRLERIL